MCQNLSCLPIFISEIGNNSISGKKVNVSPVGNTFEGSFSYPNKYRLNLPRGHYTYILEADNSIRCNLDIFNVEKEAPLEDTFIDFELSVKVPYGAHNVHEPSFFLYIYGGFYQGVKMPCMVYPLKADYLDKWGYNTWHNANSSKIDFSEEKITVHGIDKSLIDSSVYENKTPIRENCFYSINISDVNLDIENFKYAMSGLRVFQDGNNCLAIGINNTIQIITIKDGVYKNLNENDIKASRIQGLGFSYRGDNLYEFWYLEKEKFVWERLGDATMEHSDQNVLGIFVSKTKGSMSLDDLVQIKY